MFSWYENLTENTKAFMMDALFVVLLFFKFFMYDVSMVPSASMTPTFITGDLVVVNKHCIRWSVLTLPYGGILGFAKKGYEFGIPKRGTPCTFTLPKDPFTYYLKRMIATEGDSVQMVNGLLHINDKPVKMKFIKKMQLLNDEGLIEDGAVYEIELEDGTKYNIYRNRPFGKGYIDNTARFIVPKGHVWMQGDNHTGSTDSFSMTLMGALPSEYLIATPVFVIINSNSRGGQKNMIPWLLSLPISILKFVYNFNFSRCMFSAKKLIQA